MTDQIDLGLLPKNIAKQIADLVEQAATKASPDEKKAAKAYPRYVFTRDINRRENGTGVKVTNAFEEVGGTVVRKISDVAYVVRVEDELEVVVHEPDEAWV